MYMSSAICPMTKVLASPMSAFFVYINDSRSDDCQVDTAAHAELWTSAYTQKGLHFDRAKPSWATTAASGWVRSKSVPTHYLFATEGNYCRMVEGRIDFYLNIRAYEWSLCKCQPFKLSRCARTRWYCAHFSDDCRYALAKSSFMSPSTLIRAWLALFVYSVHIVSNLRMPHVPCSARKNTSTGSPSSPMIFLKPRLHLRTRT